jgi:hypothetical protein
MSFSILREVPRVTQEPFSEYLVDIGSLRLKVWHKSTTYLCLLVEEDPSALIEFREGETLILKYHRLDSSLPSERLRTTVRKIKREKEGKLKGHYLIDLEILTG